MVHDIGTESVSDDDPAQSGGMMADLPPLLLGTYTPKIDAKGRMGIACEVPQPTGLRHGDGKRPGTMRLPAAAIGIQTDRGADPTHVHGKQGGHATTCVCSFPARSTRSQTSKDACLCRRCSAITRIWTATLW